MPGYDRTGPRGAGPRSGGGFGYCRSAGAPGARFNRGFGSGFAAGGAGQRGRAAFGRRQRRFSWFNPENGTLPPEALPDEKGWLTARAERIKAELDSVEKRLAELG